MRRRPLRRVVGVAAVGAVAGGVGYYAGRKSAQPKESQTQLSESETPDKLEELKKLGELRDAGTITEEEFEREKQKILAAE